MPMARALADVGQSYETKHTYSISIQNASIQGKDDRYRWFCDRFNVDFQFWPVDRDDWDEKVRIWIASGEMPDVFAWNVVDASELRNWSRQGRFRKMPELGERYPNLQRVSDVLTSDDYYRVDGELYCWPRVTLDLFDADSRDYNPIGFYYRQDWAEKLGMKRDIYTWDEMVELARAFIVQDPGRNGPGKTIGLACAAWAFPQMAGIDQLSPYWDGFVVRDGRYVWGASLPETREGLKIANSLYDEGVIWRDQILARDDDAPNRLTAGEVGICLNTYNVPVVDRMLRNFAYSHPGIDPDTALAPMHVLSPDGTILAYERADHWMVSIVNASMSDAKFERLLDMWDWLMSEEGRLFMIFGIKGKDWDYDERGRIICLYERDQDGNVIEPYDRATQQVFSLAGLPGGGALDVRFSEAARRKVSEYEMARDVPYVEVKEINYDVLYFSGAHKDGCGDIASQVRTKMMELIVTSDQIEIDWQEWVDSMMPQVQLVLDELNAGLLGSQQEPF